MIRVGGMEKWQLGMLEKTAEIGDLEEDVGMIRGFGNNLYLVVPRSGGSSEYSVSYEKESGNWSCVGGS